MLKEEKGYKAKLLDNLETNSIICNKLSKEMGVPFVEPDSNLSLLKLQHAVRAEARKLEAMKEERMKEVLKLKSLDEELCTKLCMDPFYISSTTVPTTAQLEGVKDHIKRMEEEKFDREERFINLKESILQLYTELEEEPVSDMEREIACEDTERFILSSTNLSQAADILKMLENQVKANQKRNMELVEKISSLYERLRLDVSEKYKFLSVNQGHGKSVLAELQFEVDRLEELKKANIEQFIINLRNELNDLWDRCFYSENQKNAFEGLHSIDFTEDLLESHEAELGKMKEYLELNRELFIKVEKRQEIWSKFMELERKAKDPSRLMNARGTALLEEEKERNKVNKTLPRVEQELHELIQQWEQEHGRDLRVSAVSFAAFIEEQKEEHLRGLEMEKIARDKAKKENLLHETRFGAKPSTPAKLKSFNTTKTPRKMVTPSASTSRQVRKVSSAVASIRSPRAGKIAKGVSPRFGGTAANKKKKMAAENERKMKKGILSESNYTLVNKSVIRGQPGNESLASSVPDYADFKRGGKLNSTEAMVAVTPEVTRPSYLTPTASSNNRMFKTPTSSVSRSRLGTPKSMTKSTPQLSRLRSGKNLPMLF